MFSPDKYDAMYKRFLGPLARPITVMVKNGDAYIGYPMTAHVTAYNESDLVPGGTVQLGDLRLIILADTLKDLGIGKLGLKDRINIDDRAYSIVHWDDYTRSAGSRTIAIEATVRGGGSGVVASIFVYRSIDNGDRRITSNGDYRVIREAV
jgi:hypothetical protein